MDRVSRQVRLGRGDLVGEVAGALRDLFTSGAMQPGTKLANEITLAEQLKVSRPTLREAVRILIQENYLESRRGIGTFVVRPAPHLRGQLDMMRSLSDFIAQTGATPGIRNLQIRQVRASRDVAAALAVTPGVAVAHVTRTRLADARPVAWANEYVALSGPITFDRVRKFDGASLYRFMREGLSLALNHGELAISAISAPRVAATRLGLRAGDPVLLMREIVFDGERRPLLLTVNHHNSAAAMFSMTRSGRAA